MYIYRATFRSTLQKCGIIVMDLIFSKQTNENYLSEKSGLIQIIFRQIIRLFIVKQNKKMK